MIDSHSFEILFCGLEFVGGDSKASVEIEQSDVIARFHIGPKPIHQTLIFNGGEVLLEVVANSFRILDLHAVPIPKAELLEFYFDYLEVAYLMSVLFYCELDICETIGGA